VTTLPADFSLLWASFAARGLARGGVGAELIRPRQKPPASSALRLGALYAAWLSFYPKKLSFATCVQTEARDRHLLKWRGRGLALRQDGLACPCRSPGAGGLRSLRASTPPHNGSIRPGRVLLRWEPNRHSRKGFDGWLAPLRGSRRPPSWRLDPGARRRRVYHGVDQVAALRGLLAGGAELQQRRCSRQSRQRGRTGTPSRPVSC